MKLVGVVLALAGATACARHGVPQGSPTPLARYEILVPGRDSLSAALAAAFSREGFTVRDDVRGGGRPAAALVLWRFVDLSGRGSLEAQLADTRRGTVLASTTIPADTLRDDLPARAMLIVRGLLAPSP